jgi:type IV secretory pathway VirB2 component (pilin)
MSKLTKNVISFAFVAVIAVTAMTASAALTVPEVSNLGTGDLENTAIKIIDTLLGLLGLVALVMILIGGFKWMTSGGNEEKVGEAKKLLGAGVVGIIIILAAYAIAHYVVSTMGTAIS